MYSRKKLYPSCCRMLQSFKKQYLKTNHIQFSGIKLHEMINVSSLAVSYVFCNPIYHRGWRHGGAPSQGLHGNLVKDKMLGTKKTKSLCLL